MKRRRRVKRGRAIAIMIAVVMYVAMGVLGVISQVSAQFFGLIGLHFACNHALTSLFVLSALPWGYAFMDWLLEAMEWQE